MNGTHEGGDSPRMDCKECEKSAVERSATGSSGKDGGRGGGGGGGGGGGDGEGLQVAGTASGRTSGGVGLCCSRESERSGSRLASSLVDGRGRVR